MTEKLARVFGASKPFIAIVHFRARPCEFASAGSHTSDMAAS